MNQGDDEEALRIDIEAVENARLEAEKKAAEKKANMERIRAEQEKRAREQELANR